VKEDVEENYAQSASSPNILCLKGLSTQKGNTCAFMMKKKRRENLLYDSWMYFFTY